MGNVLAASADPKSGLAAPPSLTPPTLASLDSKKSKLENPGTYEELHKRCKGKIT